MTSPDYTKIVAAWHEDTLKGLAYCNALEGFSEKYRHVWAELYPPKPVQQARQHPGSPRPGLTPGLSATDQTTARRVASLSALLARGVKPGTRQLRARSVLDVRCPKGGHTLASIHETGLDLILVPRVSTSTIGATRSRDNYAVRRSEGHRDAWVIRATEATGGVQVQLPYAPDVDTSPHVAKRILRVLGHPDLAEQWAAIQSTWGQLPRLQVGTFHRYDSEADRLASGRFWIAGLRILGDETLRRWSQVDTPAPERIKPLRKDPLTFLCRCGLQAVQPYEVVSALARRSHNLLAEPARLGFNSIA